MSTNVIRGQFYNKLIHFIKNDVKLISCKEFNDFMNDGIVNNSFKGKRIYSYNNKYLEYNLPSYNKMVDILLTSRFRHEFSYNLISRYIFMNIAQHDDFRQQASKISNKIVNIFSKHTKYITFVPVLDLFFERGNYKEKVGLVTFYDIVNVQMHIDDVCSKDSSKISNLDKLISSYIKQHRAKNEKNRAFALVVNKTFSKESAVLTSRNIVNHIINMLIVYRSTKPWIQYDLSIGNNYFSSFSYNGYMTFDENKSMVNPIYVPNSKDSEQKLYLVKFIDSLKNDKKLYYKNIIGIFNDIYRESKLTPMEYSICNTIQLISNAISSNNVKMKFVEFTSSIESLLENNSYGIEKDISTKLAFLLGCNSNSRENIFNMCEHLYNIRSLIVHGETISHNKHIIITSKDLYNIWGLSKNILIKIVSNLDKFNDTKSSKKGKLNKYIKHMIFYSGEQN